MSTVSMTETLSTVAPSILRTTLKPKIPTNFFQQMQQEIPGAMQPTTLSMIVQKAKGMIEPGKAKLVQEQSNAAAEIATLKTKKAAYRVLGILAGTVLGVVLLSTLGSGLALIPLALKIAVMIGSSYALFKTSSKQERLHKEIASQQGIVESCENKLNLWRLLQNKVEDTLSFQSYLNNEYTNRGSDVFQRGKAFLKNLEQFAAAPAQ